ncbi:MAG: hypothetical protein ACMUHM_01645 [Thermoplasmatota archaeon]
MEGKVWLVPILLLLMLAPALIILMVDDDPVVGSNDVTRSFDGPSFFTERIYHENDLVYRATSADLMADDPGDELATCSKNGKVVVIHGTRWSWTSTVVHRATHAAGGSETAQVYSLDSGDVIPEEEGDELIAVDETYSVKLIQYNEKAKAWSTDVLWRDMDWLYEVDIGELVGGPEQPEIVVVGEQKRATMLSRSGDIWISTTIATDSDIFEACWIADLYPERPGNEVLLGGGRGILFSSYLEDGIWKQEELFDLESQITDLLVVDMDPAIDGEEVYASTIKGNVWKVWMTEGNWTGTVIHSENKLIYGMETGIYRDAAILSIGTWNNRVGIIWYQDGFQFQEVYREEYLIMGTAILDIDPAYEGAEILALSYLGRVTMIYQEDAGAEIILPFQWFTVSVGETVKVPFIVEGLGGYEGDVELSIHSNGGAYNIQLSESSVSANSISYLEVRGISPSEDPIPGMIQANTSHGIFRKSVFVHVKENVAEYTIPGPVIETEVNADGQTGISFDVVSQDQEPFDLQFSKFLLPVGMALQGVDEDLMVDKNHFKIYGILSSERWVPVRDYRFFMITDGGNGTLRAVGVNVEVNPWQEPTFRLSIEEPLVSIPVGGNTTLVLNAISLNGFEENVSLTYSPDVPGISISFSEDRLQPTGSVEVLIELTEPLEDQLITLIGTAGMLKIETYLFLKVEPPAKFLELTFERDGYTYENEDNGMATSRFWVIFTPRNGELRDLKIELQGLPDNFTATYAPKSLQSLYYPINISFMITGPEKEAPGSVLVKVSGPEEGPWSSEVTLIKEEEPADGNDDNGRIILLIILGTILFLAAGAGLYFRLRASRDLNRDEDLEEAHGRDVGLPRRSASPERFHGSRSGPDRFHR